MTLGQWWQLGLLMSVVNIAIWMLVGGCAADVTRLRHRGRAVRGATPRRDRDEQEEQDQLDMPFSVYLTAGRGGFEVMQLSGRQRPAPGRLRRRTRQPRGRIARPARRRGRSRRHRQSQLPLGHRSVPKGSTTGMRSARRIINAVVIGLALSGLSTAAETIGDSGPWATPRALVSRLAGAGICDRRGRMRLGWASGLRRNHLRRVESEVV